MSHSRREAPRELVAILWSIAGLLALFFAISISSLFIIKTYFPVDASTVTQAIDRPIDGKCKEGYSAIAVNNYPGPDNITKYVGGNAAYKTAEVLKPLGGKNFRCSQICVPGLSSAAGSETTNRSKVAEYLNGGSLNGKPIVIVSNGEAFMQKWIEWNKESNQSKKDFLAQDLQRTVIQSQSKPDCKGPNSEDYGTMTTSKGEAVDLNKPNTTAQEAEQAGRTTEQASGQPSGGTGATGTTDQPLAGAPEKQIKVPSNPQPQADTGPSEKELANARSKLNDCVYKSLHLYNKLNADTSGRYNAQIKDSEMTGYYKTVSALSTRRKNTQDPTGDLAKCNALLKGLNKVDTAIVTWKSKNRNFDPWDEEGNSSQKYGFSEAERAKREYYKAVYSYWGDPKLFLSAFGAAYKVTAKTDGLNGKKFYATWVQASGSKDCFWSTTAFAADLKFNPTTLKWTRYKRTYSGIQGCENYPKIIPSPLSAPYVIF